MKHRGGLVVVPGIALAVLGFVLATVVAQRASAHRSGCHAAHTCPSDHHTYVWFDPSTGAGWDCAEPGAPELDPARDTQTIVWQGLTWHCRAAAATAPPPTTLPPTSVPETSTVTTGTSTTTTTTTDGLVLPNPKLTPGAYNASVRQSTIGRTICVRGWTSTVRPPVAYTNALKLKQMPLYEETGPPAAYEEDHLIPLELGGAPRDPRNLWPEPRTQSRKSDPLETSLKRKVCARTLTLAAARVTMRRYKFTHG